MLDSWIEEQGHLRFIFVTLNLSFLSYLSFYFCLVSLHCLVVVLVYWKQCWVTVLVATIVFDALNPTSHFESKTYALLLFMVRKGERIEHMHLLIKLRWLSHRANGTKKNCSWKLRLSLQTASLYSYFTNEMTETYLVSRICLRLCHILSFWPSVSWVPGHQVGPLFCSDLSLHWNLRHKMWNTKYSHTWGLLWAVFHLSTVVFKIGILFCPEIKRTNAQYYMIPFLKPHESLEML